MLHYLLLSNYLFYIWGFYIQNRMNLSYLLLVYSPFTYSIEYKDIFTIYLIDLFGNINITDNPILL